MFVAPLAGDVGDPRSWNGKRKDGTNRGNSVIWGEMQFSCFIGGESIDLLYHR